MPILKYLIWIFTRQKRDAFLIEKIKYKYFIDKCFKDNSFSNFIKDGKKQVKKTNFQGSTSFFKIKIVARFNFSLSSECLEKMILIIKKKFSANFHLKHLNAD